jgi:hypothetical protein
MAAPLFFFAAPSFCFLVQALEQGPAPLGVAPSVLGAAKSGRERKATARFRPRLGV